MELYRIFQDKLPMELTTEILCYTGVMRWCKYHKRYVKRVTITDAQRILLELVPTRMKTFIFFRGWKDFDHFMKYHHDPVNHNLDELWTRIEIHTMKLTELVKDIHPGTNHNNEACIHVYYNCFSKGFCLL